MPNMKFMTFYYPYFIGLSVSTVMMGAIFIQLLGGVGQFVDSGLVYFAGGLMLTLLSLFYANSRKKTDAKKLILPFSVLVVFMMTNVLLGITMIGQYHGDFSSWMSVWFVVVLLYAMSYVLYIRHNKKMVNEG